MKRMADSLEKLLSLLDKTRLQQNLVKLVNEYSPSYAETDAVEALADILKSHGIVPLLQPVGSGSDKNEDDRHNLIIRMGQAPYSLLLIGHIDTIDLWHEGSHRARIVDDRLYGLGAADMKGGCAAMLEAVLALHESRLPLKHGLCVGFVVGEEQYGDGSKALRETIQAPLVILGEPTGLSPCLSHYSYLEIRLNGKGLRAHAALPEIGANAIHAVLSWLLKILDESQALSYSDYLSINPREIQGGEPSFVVPDSCEAHIDIHLPPDVGMTDIINIIEKTRSAVLASHREIKLDFEQVFWADGYSIDEKDQRLIRLRDAFSKVELAWEPDVFRSHSDACLFKPPESVPVVCGPGDLSVAHRREEFVQIPEIEGAARLYAAVIHECCIR
jgi:acetylornithine deacetylase